VSLETRLREILPIPTAPFAEGRVHARIRAAVRKNGRLRDRVDEHGNLEVAYGKGRPDLWFTCHTDHPAFRLERGGLARIEGGVRPAALRGARLCTLDGGGPRPVVRGATKTGKLRLKGSAGLPIGAPLVLDLPGVSLARGRVRARAIDDLCAVAACLAVIDRLSRARWDGSVGFLFTRAEEVGFAGALAWARATRLPKKTTLVNLEMSSARRHTPIGEGPILRVGDRVSVYDDGVARSLEACAKRLRGFSWQRALMDGGACEATVFAAAGFRTGALCLPLGNYHNHARGGGVGREYVARADAEGLVAWMAAYARGFGGRDESAPLRERLERLRKKHAKRLRRTAGEGRGR